MTEEISPIRWFPWPTNRPDSPDRACEVGSVWVTFRGEVAFIETTSEWRWDVWEFETSFFFNRSYVCGGYETNREAAQREAEIAIRDVAAAKALKTEAIAAAYARIGGQR